DLVPAAACELRQPVGLDLPLRVEPELSLHADLDPEALAIEPVLVALVEPPHRLVPLEHVLQRPAPRGVDGEDLVRRHRSVDEAPLGSSSIELAEALEGSVPVPAIEHLQLQDRMVRLGPQPGEHSVAILRHAPSKAKRPVPSRDGARPPRYHPDCPAP